MTFQSARRASLGTGAFRGAVFSEPYPLWLCHSLNLAAWPLCSHVLSVTQLRISGKDKGKLARKSFNNLEARHSEGAFEAPTPTIAEILKTKPEKLDRKARLATYSGIARCETYICGRCTLAAITRKLGKTPRLRLNRSSALSRRFCAVSPSSIVGYTLGGGALLLSDNRADYCFVHDVTALSFFFCRSPCYICAVYTDFIYCS